LSDVREAYEFAQREVPRRGAAREFVVEATRMQEAVGAKLRELSERLSLLPLGPRDAQELLTWGGEKLSYFRESLDLMRGAETVEAWRRRLELLEFYWRWGAVAPSVEEARRAVPDVSRVRENYGAFFAPWVHLREVFYRRAEDEPGDALQTMRREFRLRYVRVMSEVGERVDELSNYLRNVRGAATGGGDGR
jgi:hypothetical protein